MRTFGNDAPRFMEFKLAGHKKAYKLPLAASLRPDYNLRMYEALTAPEEEREYKTQRFIVDMFSFYLGPEFVESISSAVMIEIWHAWLEESRDAGQEPGE